MKAHIFPATFIMKRYYTINLIMIFVTIIFSKGLILKLYDDKLDLIYNVLKFDLIIIILNTR